MNVPVPLTVVIPTLNEAPRIAEAIESVRWADEVIVADGGSTDDTVAVAERAGARVIGVPNRTVGQQRNAAIELARHKWILALDADERATLELRESLTELCSRDGAPHTAYRIRSRNWHLGRELRHGPWGRDWKIRVFSREHRFSDARVHENLVSAADVGSLEGALIHYPYRDLSHQVAKIATYAKWAADDMRRRGRRATAVDLLARPAWRFVRDYILYSGWRDGAAGFVVATVSAFSVFCKYACLLTERE
ncbi:MAG TPA: glycosyltransferase family 2 protein [Gemmatimonadaceae bacterium]|nr:glycosyltransferase family 2 protein [Gemmatimonadaceae bacterium]